MLKKLVRVANAIFDLENNETDDESNRSRGDYIPQTGNDAFDFSDIPSPEVLRAIKTLSQSGILNRPAVSSREALKKKLAEYSGFPVDNISCYPGKARALENIARTYFEQGTELLSCEPLPLPMLMAAKTAGASVKETSFGDPFSPSLEPIIDNITRRTRIIYLGNPSELTGSYFTEAELVFLLAYAENSMIVVDESYFELSGFTIADLAEKFPNLTVVRSIAAPFGLSGLNLGYIITDPENLGFINRLGVGDTIDPVSLIATKAALDNLDRMREHIDRTNRSRELISGSLPGFGFDFYVQPTDFIILSVCDAPAACDQLKNNGIPVTDISRVISSGGLIRIPIGSPDDTDRLLLVLSRMAEKFATGFNRNRIGKSSKDPEIETHHRVEAE